MGARQAILKSMCAFGPASRSIQAIFRLSAVPHSQRPSSRQTNSVRARVPVHRSWRYAIKLEEQLL